MIGVYLWGYLCSLALLSPYFFMAQDGFMSICIERNEFRLKYSYVLAFNDSFPDLAICLGLANSDTHFSDYFLSR